MPAGGIASPSGWWQSKHPVSGKPGPAKPPFSTKPIYGKPPMQRPGGPVKPPVQRPGRPVKPPMRGGPDGLSRKPDASAGSPNPGNGNSYY